MVLSVPGLLPSLHGRLLHALAVQRAWRLWRGEGFFFFVVVVLFWFGGWRLLFDRRWFGLDLDLLDLWGWFVFLLLLYRHPLDAGLGVSSALRSSSGLGLRLGFSPFFGNYWFIFGNYWLFFGNCWLFFWGCFEFFRIFIHFNQHSKIIWKLIGALSGTTTPR